MATATWTRVLCVFNEQPPDSEAASVQVDLMAAHDDLVHDSHDHVASWAPLFDPQDFQRHHKDVKLEDWKIETDVLHAIAERFAVVR